MVSMERESAGSGALCLHAFTTQFMPTTLLQPFWEMMSAHVSVQTKSIYGNFHNDMF